MKSYGVNCHACDSEIPIDLQRFDLKAIEHQFRCARCGYLGTYHRESVHAIKPSTADEGTVADGVTAQ